MHSIYINSLVLLSQISQPVNITSTNSTSTLRASDNSSWERERLTVRRAVQPVERFKGSMSVC